MPLVWMDGDMAAKSRIKGDIHTSLHDSAVKHVSGRAIYVDDIATSANCLTVLIGQSQHAHARIRGMDLSAVGSAWRGGSDVHPISQG